MPSLRHWAVFACFTAAYFLSYFFRSANAVLAPDLSAELGLGAPELGLMTSLFFAAFAAVQLPLGVALDRLGPRWMTPALMLVGVAGSLLFALAPSFGWLALGRALIGVGMAGILMGALTSFSRWFPARRYATVSGLLVGIGSTGALVAAAPLAWLNTLMGWRGVFGWGALVIALVALSIVLFTRNAPPGEGATRATATTAAPVGGMGAVFGSLSFWRIAVLVFFTNGTLLAFQGLWAGPYLFDIYRLGRVEAGGLLTWLSVGATLGFALVGWLADKFGLTRVVVVGSALFAVLQGVLALAPAALALPAFLLAFGLSGAASMLLLTQARLAFPAHLTGRAVTAVNVFGIGGTFLLQSLMGVLIGTFPKDAAGHYPPEAYGLTLALTALGTVLATVFYAPLWRERYGG